MKKIAIGLLLLLSNLLLAQESQDAKKERKFQVGVHYVGNLRNENSISDGFNGVAGLTANYAFYQDELVVLSGGVTMDYLESRNLFLKKSSIIWNPNLSIEVTVFNAMLTPFFGVGYAFFNSEFHLVSGLLDPFDPMFSQARAVNVHFKGVTLNPGCKYAISDLLFIESSYTYFAAKSNDLYGASNVHLVNFGLGVKF